MRTQPESMRTERYQYGVDLVDGTCAWALFEACRKGELERVRELLDTDPKLVHSQCWYQFPIHLAVRAGQPDVVRLLLERGAEPGRARFMYDSWQNLLDDAEERGHRQCSEALSETLRERYGYEPAFAELRDAIQSRDLSEIESVLDKRPRLAHASDCYGNSAMHWAVLTRQLDLVDRLVELGVNLDRQRADGQTPAHVALNGDYNFRAWQELRGLDVPDAESLVRRLLERGAFFDLSLACALGDQRHVDELIERGPELAATLDSGRRSPLLYASRSGHLEIVRSLLEAGADPNRAEELAPRGHALFVAAQENHLEIAELLLAHGADPNGESDSSGCCLSIVQHRHGTKAAEPMVALLRRHGATTPLWELSADEMKTALIEDARVVSDPYFFPEALARNDVELVELLARHQPERFARLHGGLLRCGDPDASLTESAALARLLELGFDPNRASWLGKTALHHYAGYGDVANLKLLIDHGGRLDVLDDEHGGTPLSWAARKGRTEAVRFLLDCGSDPLWPEDRPWAQPLTRAEQNGHEEAAAHLRAAASFR